jgi:hypothetical protein
VMTIDQGDKDAAMDVDGVEDVFEEPDVEYDDD